MEAHGGTQKSGHVPKGACAMWKNESALAAHRQIGRMLHNHYGLDGSELTQDEAKRLSKEKAFKFWRSLDLPNRDKRLIKC